MATRLCDSSGKGPPMDKPQAGRPHDSGREPTVGKPLELDQECKTLKAKIAGLSADSTNSCKPPSSDGPQVVRPEKKKSSRSPGGRKGHRGHKREPAAGQARQSLPESANLNIDETGWKCKGDRRYLRVFVSHPIVCFTMAASRGAEVLRSVPGETFNGESASDDHSARSSYRKKRLQQLCRAHSIRKTKGLKRTRGSPDREVCARAEPMFRNWPHPFAFIRHTVKILSTFSRISWKRHSKGRPGLCYCTESLKPGERLQNTGAGRRNQWR